MSITTDLSGCPILDVDYGHSSMSGFNGENYFNWSIEKYLDYVKSYNPKKAESHHRRHKQKMGVYGKE